jgi:hypothetical protein
MLFFGPGFSTSRSHFLARLTGIWLVTIVLALFGFSANAFAVDPTPPVDPGQIDPPAPPPSPAPDPNPPADQVPPPDPSPPPAPAPPGDQNPVQPPSDPAPSAGPKSSDGSSDTFVLQSADQSGSGANSSSPAPSSANNAVGHNPSGASKDTMAAIPPSVDNFDSFSGSSGGADNLLPTGGTSGCVACNVGAATLVAAAAASPTQIQQNAARERDSSRVEGLAKAMPPGPPGGVPGRSFGMPGGTGGGGAAFLLISMIAILCAALARGLWTTSFRLPTATWRLSAYVPPIESPG